MSKMYNKLEKKQPATFETFEVNGEFKIENRHNDQGRRKIDLAHWRRYDRRLQRRRSSIHSRVDIEV